MSVPRFSRCQSAYESGLLPTRKKLARVIRWNRSITAGISFLKEIPLRSASISGGGKEIRTPDFQLAKLALYQLSYAPVAGRPLAGHAPSQTAGRLVAINWSVRCCSNNVVGLSGLEPLTSRLSGVCSNQLSYKPPRVLLRFRRYALVKDTICRWQTTTLRQSAFVTCCGNATAAEKRRAIYIYWIVAFDNGLETSQSSLFYHPEWAVTTHHF